MNNNLDKITGTIVKSVLSMDRQPSPKEIVSSLLSIASSIMQAEQIDTFEIAETEESALKVTQIAVNNIDLTAIPQAGSEWMDIQNQAAFIVVTVTNVMGAVDIVQNPIQVAYKDMDGNAWSMPLYNWMQRMTPLQA